MNFKFLTKIVVLGVAGSIATFPAFAEWQWLDKEGRKVFSDRPPPTDISQKNILKEPVFIAPGVSSQGMVSMIPTPAASASTAKSTTPKLSGSDVALEARKKQADAVLESKKQAEAEKLANVKADNCERVKRSQTSLNSGIRIVITNTKGEREFMDDAERSLETKRLQAIADSDCVK